MGFGRLTRPTAGRVGARRSCRHWRSTPRNYAGGRPRGTGPARPSRRGTDCQASLGRPPGASLGEGRTGGGARGTTAAKASTQGTGAYGRDEPFGKVGSTTAFRSSTPRRVAIALATNGPGAGTGETAGTVPIRASATTGPAD